MLEAPANLSSSLLTPPPRKVLLTWGQAIEKILQLGIEAAPEEVCGVMVPQDERCSFWEVHQLRNRADDRTAGYEIDPATIGQLCGNPSVWGDVIVWHTHPSGHVGPSEGDLRYAVPGVRYLVVAIPTGEWVQFRSPSEEDEK